jgi:hypothetical protein
MIKATKNHPRAALFLSPADAPHHSAHGLFFTFKKHPIMLYNQGIVFFVISFEF